MIRLPCGSMMPTTIPTLWRYLSIRSETILRISESGGMDDAGVWLTASCPPTSIATNRPKVLEWVRSIGTLSGNSRFLFRRRGNCSGQVMAGQIKRYRVDRTEGRPETIGRVAIRHSHGSPNSRVPRDPPASTGCYLALLVSPLTDCHRGQR